MLQIKLRQIIQIFISFLLITPVFFPLKTFSQTAGTIKAAIYDSVSKEPVPYANIIIKGTLEGAITDEKGYFEISTKQKMPVLVISSIGYFTKEINYDPVKSFDIRLQPKTISLQEIVVSGRKTTVFLEHTGYHYIDFDFYDDNILALAALGNKRYLQVLNDRGEVVSNLKVHNKSASLFKDCIGNIHLLTTDSSYQVYYDYAKIRLLSSYSIDVFNKVLVPCLVSYKGAYYFRQNKYRGLKCEYFCVKESEPGKIYPFKLIADSSRIKNFNSQYDLHYFLEIRRITRGEKYGESVNSIIANIDKHREELELDWADSKWLQPIEAELHKIDNSLYLFNFTDSVIEAYNDHDSLKYKVPFNLYKNNPAMHNLVVDESLRAAFLPFERSGIISLHRIDLSTGNEIGSFEISNFPFPVKLKVLNGMAYFLSKDKAAESPRKIIKVRL